MILTVIAVLLLIGSLMAMQAVFRDDFKGLGQTFRSIFLAHVLLTVVSAIGLVLMRRWSVLLYALITLVGHAALAKYGWFNPVNLLFSIVVCLVGFLYFKRMRW